MAGDSEHKDFTCVHVLLCSYTTALWNLDRVQCDESTAV